MGHSLYGWANEESPLKDPPLDESSLEESHLGELTFVRQHRLGDFPFSNGRYHGHPWGWMTYFGWWWWKAGLVDMLDESIVEWLVACLMGENIIFL